MQKLKLDVEELRVETFEPAAEESERRGTVRGQADEVVLRTIPLSDCVFSLCRTCEIHC